MKLTKLTDPNFIDMARRAAYLTSLRDDATTYGIAGDKGDLLGTLILEDRQIAGSELNSVLMHFAGKPAFWRSRRAMNLVLKFIFERLGAELIRAEIDAENVPMQVVALRWGFRFDGRAPSWEGGEKVCMSMRARDFKPWRT